MCGIVGWILSADRASDERTLLRLTNQLSHRGPDSSGTWIGKTADERFQIGLGHRRLSIIDIAGGTQPMLSADGSVVVTFNGEIYNYIELRDELSSRGHKFQTSSDTEVLIEAYRQWGEAALPRFRGMFAFVLFDSDQQRVVFARDPFGKKPLFLVERGGNLLFASEIQADCSVPLLRLIERGHQVRAGRTNQNFVTSVKLKSRTFIAGTTMSKVSSPEARTAGESELTLDSISIRF